MTNKARHFAINLDSNSMLEDNVYLTSLLLTEHKLCNVSIKVWEVSKFDSKKATGSNKIIVVVLKNIIPELSKILVKLSEEEMLSNFIEGVNCVLWFFRMLSSIHACRNIDPQFSLVSLLLQSIINRRVVRHLNRINFMSDSQYGSRPVRSATDSLSVIT